MPTFFTDQNLFYLFKIIICLVKIVKKKFKLEISDSTIRWLHMKYLLLDILNNFYCFIAGFVCFPNVMNCSKLESEFSA